jgi:hypothetical protein
MRRLIMLALALGGLAAGAVALAAGPVSATATSETYVADETGSAPVSTTTNGILYIYSTDLATQKSVNAVYYMRDGYFKMVDFPNGGTVLAEEDFENNCASNTPGSVNPVGGTGISCLPVLQATQPAPYPVTGDLQGAYCRVPPPGSSGACPFNVTRTETATGSGAYLTVGNKDHGAMMKISYKLASGKTEYIVLPGNCLLTRVIISATPAGQSDHATITLEG